MKNAAGHDFIEMIAGSTAGGHAKDFVQLMAGRKQLDMAILGMKDTFIQYSYMCESVNICMFVCMCIYVYMCVTI